MPSYLAIISTNNAAKINRQWLSYDQLLQFFGIIPFKIEIQLMPSL
jgi:hypothetical protein